MIVASMAMATARPKPNCFRPMSLVKAKISATTTIIAAALVITPAVSFMPRAMASSVLSPCSYFSLIRAMTNIS